MAVLAPPDRPNAEPGAPGGDVDPSSPEVPPLDPAATRPDGTEVRTGNDIPVPAVTAMFDEIAPVYDRVNTLLSFGADGRWRRAAVRATGVPPGGTVIDVACGTGKLAAELAEQVGPFGRVLAVDLSEGMIARGSDAFRDVVQLEFRCADALRLPVPDGQYDAATIAFGLRNLADFEAGFRELRRVVRPGGRVVCLELTTPRPRWWGRAFLAAFGRMAPLAGSLAGRAAAYRYLRASLDGFPDAEQLTRTMRSAGLESVTVRRLGLGSIALHVGMVPAP